MSPSGTQSRLAYSLLQTGTFLKFSITVLSCNTTDCMFRQPSDPSMSPLWDLRSKKTKMMFNVACCASDSKVLCLKQKSFMSFASIHETVTGYLTQNWGKIKSQSPICPASPKVFHVPHHNHRLLPPYKSNNYPGFYNKCKVCIHKYNLSIFKNWIYLSSFLIYRCSLHPFLFLKICLKKKKKEGI